MNIREIVEADLSKQVVEFATYVSSNKFPWYHHNTSTRQGLPYLAHIAIPRSNINSDVQIVNSPVYYEIERIFNKFCEATGLNYDRIYRCCLNLTYDFGVAKQTDPHVDHVEDHNCFILYLNSCSGDTILYNERYGVELNEHMVLANQSPEKLTEMVRVKPEYGKAICFNGNHMHAHDFCGPGERRMTCIVTFK